MLAENVGRLSLLIAAALAITACGSSTNKAIDANTGDSGPILPDMELERDLPADGLSVYQDAAADAGVDATDAAAVSPDIGHDGAGLETTLLAKDAGPDGDFFRKEAATDGVARDVAADGGSDGSIPDMDGGGVDSGPAASLVISPENASFFGDTVFTVINVSSVSTGAINVTITGSDVSHFEIASNSCNEALPPGGECQVTVGLRHYECLGEYHGSLSVVAAGFPGEEFTAPFVGFCI